jgi:glutamate-1-semialdehyde 2,1-aminomutase
MKLDSQTILERYGGFSPQSQKLFSKAMGLFPNGVTHDSRRLLPYPVYMEHARGSKKWDVEGREYVDYWSGHGALLLGHAPETVVRAVTDQISRGTHLGGCHPLEIRWAQLVTALVPSAELVRFTSSGTEATLMCIRLARTFTGKRKLLKFAGHFHGWHDQVILGVNLPYETPTPGVLEEVVDATLICPPNDIDAVEKILEEDKDVGCIIIEPTGASFGTIPTKGDFLKALREAADRHGALLIFDEVISGFRVSTGGAQKLYNVRPDLTALAKILAGGFPGGAVAGRREIMELLETRQDKDWMLYKKMPHPGTFNANPVSAAAGIATLGIVRSGEPIAKANKMARKLRNGMNETIDRHGLNWCVYGEFSEFWYLMGHDLGDIRAGDFDPSAYDYRKLKGKVDPLLWGSLRCGMLMNGIDIPPRGGLTMAAHSEEDIEKTIDAFDRTLSWMREEKLV